MFKYSLFNFDLMFPLLTVYNRSKGLKAVYKNQTLLLYTNQRRLLYTNNLNLIDLFSISKGAFAGKNLSSTFYAQKAISIFSIRILGLQYFYSNSLLKPIWEWYEREILEKTPVNFLNLSDTRNLLYGYSLKLVELVKVKPVQSSWVLTQTSNKKVELLSSFRIIL